MPPTLACGSGPYMNTSPSTVLRLVCPETLTTGSAQLMATGAAIQAWSHAQATRAYLYLGSWLIVRIPIRPAIPGKQATMESNVRKWFIWDIVTA